MSLSALSIICNIQDPGKASLLQGFDGVSTSRPSLLFRNDINALTFWPVQPTADPGSGRFWDNATIDPTKFLLGIGRADAQPTVGTWAAAYQSDSGGLMTLGFAPTASDLNADALNNPTLVAAGGVVFTQIGIGAYEMAFNLVGARDLLTTDPAGLSPQSNVFVSRKQVGDDSTKEIQIIQILQRPYIYVNSWTATPSAASPVTVLSNGSGSSIASYLLALTPLPYAGMVTVTIDGTPYSIPFNADATTFQTIIGAGWVARVIANGVWSIIATANGAHTLTADPASLSVYIGLVGTLNFSAGSLLEAFLSSASDSITASLHARYVDGTTERDTLLFVTVTMTKDVLSAAATAPTNWNNFYYDQDQIDAKFADPSLFAALDLSGLPTANPGGGKPWLNGGILQVGA